MARSSSLDQAIGALVESNRQIAEAVKSINENLKVLNDHNILHSESVKAQHEILEKNQETILQKLQVLTGKYWWLIIALIAAVLLISGLKEVAKIILPGL